MMGATSAFSALWGIQYLTTVKHISTTNAASACSLVFVGVAITSPIWGIIASYLNSSKRPLIIASLLAAINTVILLYYAHTLPVIMITCFLFGSFQSAHVLNFTLVGRIVEKNVLGTSLAFINMFTAGGGALLQPLAGWIIHYSHQLNHPHQSSFTSGELKLGLLIIPVVQALSFVISLVLIERKKKAPSERRLRLN